MKGTKRSVPKPWRVVEKSRTDRLAFHDGTDWAGTWPNLLAAETVASAITRSISQDLARVHHQTAGDESFADAFSNVSCRVHLAGTAPQPLNARVRP